MPFPNFSQIWPNRVLRRARQLRDRQVFARAPFALSKASVAIPSGIWKSHGALPARRPVPVIDRITTVSKLALPINVLVDSVGPNVPRARGLYPAIRLEPDQPNLWRLAN